MEKDVVKSENYDDITSYVNQNKLSIFAAWNDQNISLVKRKINNLHTFFQRIKKLKETERDSMFYEAGYLAGIASGLSHVLYYNNRMEEAARIYDRLNKVKYASMVVSWLGLFGGLSEMYLEEKLNSDASEALHKLVKENIVSVTISGDYKVYYLTDRGLWYFKYLTSLNDK